MYIARQPCQFSPFGPIFKVNGLDWQCYLACSSKTAPRIFIFLLPQVPITHKMKNSEIQVPSYFKHNNSFIATVLTNALITPPSCELPPHLKKYFFSKKRIFKTKMILLLRNQKLVFKMSCHDLPALDPKYHPGSLIN